MTAPRWKKRDNELLFCHEAGARRPAVFLGARASRLSLVSRHLTWGVHDDTIPNLTFSVTATTFKYAVGLRPQAAADNAIANDVAQRNRALLELIAREAKAEGGIIDTHNHNGWHVNHTIDDEVFRKLLDRHRAQLITRPLRR